MEAIDLFELAIAIVNSVPMKEAKELNGLKNIANTFTAERWEEGSRG